MTIDFTNFDAEINDGTNVQDLIAYEDESIRPETQSLPVRPPRQDFPSANEYETPPAYGDLYGQGDFSHGMGQRRYHTAGRDAKKFWYGDGIDISDPGKVRLLHKQTKDTGVTNPDRVLEIFNDLPFVADNGGGATRIKRSNGAFPSVWVAEDPGAGATTINDLTTSGQLLYAAQNNIYQRTTGAVWSLHTTNGGTPVERILFTKGRLMATDGTKIYEITGSGTTLGVGTVALETLPTGWRFEAIWEQGEFIYASAISTTLGRCEIHHYGPNQTLTALEKKGSTELPRGQLIYAGIGLGTQGLMGGGVIEQGNASIMHPIVYQTVQDARGFLDFVKLAEDNYPANVHGASGDAVKSFEVYGEAVLMSWPAYDGFTTGVVRTGLAVYYPARDAFANHLSPSPAIASNTPSCIRVYRGRILTIYPGFFYYEDLTNYVATGYLDTSVADFNTAVQKIWDTFEVSHAKLRAGESIVVRSTFDPETVGGGAVPITSDVDNDQGKTTTITTNTMQGRVLQLRIEINVGTNTALTPILYSVTARSNPFPAFNEFVMTRSFRLFSKDRKDGSAEEQISDPDTDRAALEAMAHKWVTYIEPYKTWSAYVVSVMDITPLVPIMATSGAGDADRKGYIVQIQMIGR